jgi:hypothetical protein
MPFVHGVYGPPSTLQVLVTPLASLEVNATVGVAVVWNPLGAVSTAFGEVVSIV